MEPKLELLARCLLAVVRHLLEGTGADGLEAVESELTTVIRQWSSSDDTP
ncbi:MAG: hypothetical protein IJI88_02330 [Atopobiaceae bacterium]|nr:hypothetical protein [Atopobiaceae bacterium]